MFAKLSIIIPCYNEADLVPIIIKKVLKAEVHPVLEKEIIVVDDGSTDATFSVINALAAALSHPVIILRNERNTGKGASIRLALQKVTGDIIIIQDADLEYDPAEYVKMLKPITDGYADVVYGSRFKGPGPHRVLFYFHTMGNQLLTFFSNLFTGVNLTDMETGYKMFRSEILTNIQLKEKRFGFEPEITAKICRIKGIRIYEVGISYFGRTFEEGKKINWKDGLRSLYCILKYNVFSRK